MPLPSDTFHDKLCPFERSDDADYESLLPICPRLHSGTPRHPHRLVILLVLPLRAASHVQYMKYWIANGVTDSTGYKVVWQIEDLNTCGELLISGHVPAEQAETRH